MSPPSAREPAASPSTAEPSPPTRIYAGLTAEARNEQRRTRILAAGRSLFASRPLEAVTVAEICTAARVSKQSFYDYYADRGDLFIAAHDEATQWLLESMVEVSERASVEEWLVAAIPAFLQRIVSDRERTRILIIGAAALAEPHRTLAGAYIDQLLVRVGPQPSMASSAAVRRTVLATIHGIRAITLEWALETHDVDGAEKVAEDALAFARAALGPLSSRDP